MKIKTTRKEALEKIDSFFRCDELTPLGVKKIKRLAMRFNIKLNSYKKRFCKKCFSDLNKGKIRIVKGYKTIECTCGYKNRWGIK